MHGRRRAYKLVCVEERAECVLSGERECTLSRTRVRLAAAAMAAQRLARAARPAGSCRWPQERHRLPVELPLRSDALCRRAPRQRSDRHHVN